MTALLCEDHHGGWLFLGVCVCQGGVCYACTCAKVRTPACVCMFVV